MSVNKYLEGLAKPFDAECVNKDRDLLQYTTKML